MRKRKYRKLVICLFILNMIMIAAALLPSHIWAIEKNQKVIPSGKIIGIYVETKGLLVLDIDTITGIDQVNHSPCKEKLMSGDYITKINGKQIQTKIDFIKKVRASNGNELRLTVVRNQKTIKVSVIPVKSISDYQYKIGAWVRDNTQGIGTLTFTSGRTFGGLGHGICDIDTGNQMDIKGGYVLNPSLDTIKKGESGAPGEIIGSIYYNNVNYIGTITKNTKYGIFGQLDHEESGKAYSIASKQEIQEGKAWMISCISGEKKAYQIRINKINKTNENVLKGMEIEVTDQKLLKLTSGIVQGMSGSPIIQNGKFIGAVTHVFVNDPTRGYGIFAETMLGEK